MNSADEHLSLQHVPEDSKDGEILEDNYRLNVRDCGSGDGGDCGV